MKKCTTIFFTIVGLLPFLLSGQTLKDGSSQSKEVENPVVHPTEILHPVYFDVSIPLRNMPVDMPSIKIMKDRKKRAVINPVIPDPLPGNIDPVLQKTAANGTKATVTIVQNFNGATNSSYPPDCNGSVGPNHFFQAYNTQFSIYNKTGTLVSGPTNYNTLFTGVTGANYNDGDPIILWDEQASRWFAAEFSISGSNDYMLIAVSQTADPTGSWYRWSFDVADLPDYMKFGIWRDGYYMATNNSSGNDVYVFDRTTMLAGGASPAMIGFDNPNRPSTPDGFHCIMPVDNDGTFAPAGSPALFLTINDGAWGGSDELWMYQLTTNWTTPANSTFVRTQQISVAAFDSEFDTNHAWNDITQQGSTQKLDGLSEMLMYRVQYRNFGTSENIVCCHAVDVDGTKRAGVRWYELTKSGSTWVIRQQGTYAPSTDAFSRWNASISMNGNKEIGVAYSIAGSTLYPGLRLTGQSQGEYALASGNFDVTETSFATGGTYQASYNRWGDYAQMSIDPSDDNTFWYTSEYMNSSTSSKSTKIVAFRFQEDNNPLTFTANAVSMSQIDLAWTLNSSNNPVLVAWSASPTFGTPVNGTAYSAGQTIAGGGTVLYYGSATSFNHTGLNPNTTYYYKAWSNTGTYTWSTGKTANATTQDGNPLTFAATPASSSQIDLGWALNSLNNPVMVAWSTTPTFGTPVNGTNYTAGQTITGGGNVLYYGSATAFNHTGLTAQTTYYYKAWSNLGSYSWSSGVTANATTLCGVITSFPWTEGFENGGAIPNCWSQEYVNGSLAWTFRTGAGGGSPAAAHGGTYNASFYEGAYGSVNKTKLVTPTLDLSSFSTATISFWQVQRSWSGDQDTLRVYYKNSNAGAWTLLNTYSSSVTAWTQKTITLPNLSATYYVAFEGSEAYGYGVGIDDINVSGTSLGTITTGTITPSAYCAGAGISVPFTITGTFNAGNVFTAQLSDASGSFASPVSIGTLSGTTAGTISATIPAGTTAGTAYRVRVIASNPVITGAANTSDLTIKTIPAQPSAISGQTSPCQNASETYSVTNIAGITYTWGFPSGWSQTGGGTTNSVTATVGANAGNITVMPSNVCGNGTAQTLGVVIGTSPGITTHPASVTQCEGTSLTLSVVASGTGVNYQWKKGGVDILNETGTSLTIANLQASDAGSYTCYVYNGCGNILSNAATVTVNPLAGQPSAISGQNAPCAGASETYSVTNVAGITYTWSFPATWSQTAGGTSNSVTATVGSGNGTISVTPSNGCGSGTSQTLSVTIGSTPAITNHPSSTAVCAGATLTLSVTTSGTGVQYQWKKDGSDLGGQTASTLTINNVQASYAGSYTCYVYNGCGNETSNAAVVTINPILSINTQPADQLLNLGETATFSVSAMGNNLSYLWKKDAVALSNGGDVSGATSNTLQITNVDFTDQGNYICVVNGDCGPANSDVATLTIITTIEDMNNNGINVFPNPTQGVLSVELHGLKKSGKLELFDVNGQLVYNEIFENKSLLNVDLNKFSSGVYFVSLTLEQKTYKVRVVLK